MAGPDLPGPREPFTVAHLTAPPADRRDVRLDHRRSQPTDPGRAQARPRCRSERPRLSGSDVAGSRLAVREAVRSHVRLTRLRQHPPGAGSPGDPPSRRGGRSPRSGQPGIGRRLAQRPRAQPRPAEADHDPDTGVVAHHLHRPEVAAGGADYESRSTPRRRGPRPRRYRSKTTCQYRQPGSTSTPGQASQVRPGPRTPRRHSSGCAVRQASSSRRALTTTS